MKSAETAVTQGAATCRIPKPVCGPYSSQEQPGKEIIVINMPVRKLGGTAYVVIPDEALEALGIGVGSKLDFDVLDGVLHVRPAAKSRAYPIAELLQGQIGRVARDFQPALNDRPVSC